MKWKDTTSYSYRDKNEDRIPTSWEAEIPGIRICVTKGHIYNPGKWVIHCYDLRIDSKAIADDTMPEMDAKALAVKIVKGRLDELKAAIAKAEDDEKKPKVIERPCISIDQGTKSFAIFDGFTVIRDFKPYEDEAKALGEARAWVESITSISPEVVYPAVTKITTSTRKPGRKK